MSQLPLPSFPLFLDIVKDAPGLFLDYMYSAFTFEPMHNLHLGLSKLLENCISYVGARCLCTREGGSVTAGRTFLNLEGGAAVCRLFVAHFH